MNKHFLITLCYGDGITWHGSKWAKSVEDLRESMPLKTYVNCAISVDECGGCARCLIQRRAEYATDEGIIKEDSLKEHQDPSPRG